MVAGVDEFGQSEMCDSGCDGDEMGGLGEPGGTANAGG